MAAHVGLFLLAAAAPAMCASGVSPLYVASNREEVIPNRYIVKLEDTANSFHVKMLAASIDTELMSDDVPVDLHIINAVSMTLSGEALSAIRNDSTVVYVEEVKWVYAFQSWGIDRVNQRHLPLDKNSENGGNYGAGVDVYVVDTGVDISHKQFGGRARSGHSVFPGDTSDFHGHGTHCAGTIASESYGVAPLANIVAVKVLGDDGRGTNEGVIAGLNWVAQYRIRNVPAVVSMSLGSGYSASINYATRRLVENGVTVVVAAGNENQDACNVSPASERTAITVAATTTDDVKAPYSNWGRCVDILAPGSGITSTWPRNQVNTISGTSMAAPHVSGAAALYLSLYPSATPMQVTNALLDFATPYVVRSFGTTINRLLFTNFYSMISAAAKHNSTVTVSDQCSCDSLIRKVPDQLCNYPGVCDNFPSVCQSRC